LDIFGLTVPVNSIARPKATCATSDQLTAFPAALISDLSESGTYTVILGTLIANHEQQFFGAENLVFPARFALVFSGIRLTVGRLFAARGAEAGIVQRRVSPYRGFGHALYRQAVVNFHRPAFHKKI
jgi:hypothetical protein